jgi:hypothetical protein
MLPGGASPSLTTAVELEDGSGGPLELTPIAVEGWREPTAITRLAPVTSAMQEHPW